MHGDELLVSKHVWFSEHTKLRKLDGLSIILVNRVANLQAGHVGNDGVENQIERSDGNLKAVRYRKPRRGYFVRFWSVRSIFSNSLRTIHLL